MRTDYELQGEVKQGIHKALEVVADGKAGRVWVEAGDGIVVLSGMVRNQDERDRAAQAAWGTKGVRAVYNDIRVAA